MQQVHHGACLEELLHISSFFRTPLKSYNTQVHGVCSLSEAYKIKLNEKLVNQKNVV